MKDNVKELLEAELKAKFTVDKIEMNIEEMKANLAILTAGAEALYEEYEEAEQESTRLRGEWYPIHLKAENLRTKIALLEELEAQLKRPSKKF